MKNITLGSTNNNKGPLVYSQLSETAIGINQREDASTIKKTQHFQPPVLETGSPSPSLINRVSLGEVERAETASTIIANQLSGIDSEHFQAVEKAITNGENREPDTNYIIKVQCLVAQILAQLNRISEKDRTQIDQLKSKYKSKALEAADLQRTLGAHGLKFSLVALGASFLQFTTPFQSDRDILNILTREVCPKVGDLFGSSIQADMGQANSISSLLINEYQAKTSKGSSDASSKQEIISILEKALESLKRAASAG